MSKVIGIAVVMASRTSQIVDIEHCALMGPGNQWVMEVQCRTLNGAGGIGGNVMWERLPGRYPDAKVEVKHNSATVTLPPIQEYLEVAVVGTPGENDMIRKQIAIFGPTPVKGLNWTINIILYDDTEQAFEQVRQKERGKGNKLLTARAGLFVANIEDSINIELSILQPGWRIKGSKIKVIKSRDAWKMPEDGTDFPRCSCEIVHVDESKESLICGITVSHREETTKAEVVAIFKQTLRKRQEEATNATSDYQKQTAGAYMSNTERKKKIQEESLVTFSKHKRGNLFMLQNGLHCKVHLLVAISCFLVSLHFISWIGCSEAVTKNGKSNATVIRAVRHWCLLKEVRLKERERGHKFLTAQAGLFVANIEDSINIAPSVLQPGWRIKRSETRTFRKRQEEAANATSDYQKQIVPAPISDKEREKKIEEERLITSDGQHTIKLPRSSCIVPAHISDKEQEKKIEEESLITSDEQHTIKLPRSSCVKELHFVAMWICSLILRIVLVYCWYCIIDCVVFSEVVTWNGRHNATAIIAVRLCWCFLKVLLNCFQENAETPLQQEGHPCTSGEIKAYQASDIVPAHISDKKREKKIQEECLVTSDEQHTIKLPRSSCVKALLSVAMWIVLMYDIKCVVFSEAVTWNGRHNPTAIIAVLLWWCLLKVLLNCFQENAETPLQQEGHLYTSGEIKAYQESDILPAPISDKEREKKIQEESLITSDEQHTIKLPRSSCVKVHLFEAMWSCSLMLQIVLVYFIPWVECSEVHLLEAMWSCSLILQIVLVYFIPWVECSEAVTWNGIPKATAIIAVRLWCLLKALVKCFQENAETPLEQEGYPYTSGEIKAYQQSEESSEESDIHTEREQTVTGQDCRAKSHFCMNRKIGSNIIKGPNYWYKLNEVISGVRANYKSRLPNQSYDSQRQRGPFCTSETVKLHSEVEENFQSPEYSDLRH